MLCSNTRQNQLKLTLKSNTSINHIKRRHTISSYQDKIDTAINQPNMSESGLLQHWETIEKYYVDRLNSLQKEIDIAMSQNAQLSLAREELVKEILQLHQQSFELTRKNNQLLDSVSKHSSSSYLPQGVTLEDAPYTPPTPPFNPVRSDSAPSADISTLKSHLTISPVLEQDETEASTDKPASTPIINAPKPSIFRQLSVRLSTRRKRQIEEPINNSENKKNNAQQVHHIMPKASISEPLLHPAAVLSNNGRKLSSLRRTHKKLVFGNDLILQAKSESRSVPSVVLNCIKEIELRGLTVEGIYRKSGPASQLRDLQNTFNNKKDPDLSSEDIHLVASLLKSYLRALPTPLISNDFILPPHLTDQERLNKIYGILHSLPMETYCTIKYLIQHLKRVHQNRAANFMSSRNLAVVLGPSLMNFNSVHDDNNQIIQTIDLLILQSHILFASY